MWTRRTVPIDTGAESIAVVKLEDWTNYVEIYREVNGVDITGNVMEDIASPGNPSLIGQRFPAADLDDFTNNVGVTFENQFTVDRGVWEFKGFQWPFVANPNWRRIGDPVLRLSWWIANLTLGPTLRVLVKEGDLVLAEMPDTGLPDWEGGGYWTTNESRPITIPLGDGWADLVTNWDDVSIRVEPVVAVAGPIWELCGAEFRVTYVEDRWRRVNL